MGLLKVDSIAPSGRDGRLVPFGPSEQMFWRLEVPSRLSRRVKYKSGLMLDLECVFNGERLEISQLELAQQSGEFITTQILTQLGLPGILNQIFLKASPTTAQIQSLPRKTDLTKDQLGMVVTQLYWFEYASWGNPRMSVTKYTGWSNNNANTHFRKLAKIYGLPGLHSRQQPK
jgi:hypothetical protein